MAINTDHRSCRLKRAFPDAYTKKGGLLFFDMNKISKEFKSDKKKVKNNGRKKRN